ncbi:MAG: cytochrome c3 family protein, partial [Deltaproteobacteria bacterium]
FNCHTDLPKKFKHTHPPYAKGQCFSCHRPHQSNYPNLLVRDGDALCLGCHSLSSVQKKHPNFPAKLGKCSTCHSPHGSDRPAMIRNVLHPPYAEDCQNCHTGKNKSVPVDTCLGCHPDVSEQMASSHNHLVRYGDNGCMACHSPHAGDDERLLKGKQIHVCGTCHAGTLKRREEAKFKHQLTDSCNDCHAPHGSNHPAMMKGPIIDVCTQCHEKLHGAGFTHPIGKNVFDPRTGQMMTCETCHATKGSDYAKHTRFNGKRDLCVQCHSTYQ